MYEHRGTRPLSRRRFARRLVAHGALVAGLIAVSLAIGMSGYHAFEGLPWRDAFLNAAMLLGGMGPVGEIQTTAGKLFASAFALYAGLIFLVAGALTLTPVLHRVLHRFHLEQEAAARQDGGADQT